MVVNNYNSIGYFSLELERIKQMIMTAFNLFSVIALVIVFIYTLRNPSFTFTLLVGISLLTTSLIVGGSYPAFDEILLMGVTLATLINALKTRNIKEFKNLRQSNNRTQIIFILYLLVNTLTSFLDNLLTSNLRFISLYGSLLIVLLFLQRTPQDKSRIENVTIFCIRANLFTWVLYWIFLKMINVDWATQQAKTWAGTSYAALVPSVGLMLLLLIGDESLRKIPSRKYHAYFFVSVIASVIYDSRVFSAAIFVVLIYLMFRVRSVRQIALLLVLLIGGQITGNVMVASNVSLNKFSIGQDKTLSELTKTINPIGQVKTLSESAQFINNPRSSDLDRSQQINCATRLIILESKWKNMLFGYGQSTHKQVMWKCHHVESQTSDTNKLIRPVGYAAYLIDFGVLGILLLLILVFKITLQALKTEFGRQKAFVILWILSWSFVTNDLDHLFVYIILLFNFLGEFKAKSKVS